MSMSVRAALALLLPLLWLTHPVRAQAPAPGSFVDAAVAVDGLVVDLRYFGENNFVGERIDGYESARCLLSAPAARALAEVQRNLTAHGLGLKAFDCYRPQRAVAHFVRWARAIDDVRRKAEFYPDVDKRNLFKDGYIAARSAHSRGSTVDVTLVRRLRPAAEEEAAPAAAEQTATELNMELDMGSPFDFFGPRSWPADKSVSVPARRNRAQLADTMIRCGFKPYGREWWHFTLAHEPFPGTYFDFPVR
jgi:D-alanyl-D-alanine dipeptidase